MTARVLALTWVAAIALLILLAGCATPSDPRAYATLSLAEACRAYAGALQVLAPQRAAGRLTEAQIAAVNQLNVGTDEVCLAPEPPADVADAVLRVTTAASRVLLMMEAN